MNLATNARDSMPSGGVLTFQTANQMIRGAALPNSAQVEPGEYVVLQVSDTGTGMDQSTQRQIFEPFFTTKGQGKGTGLGLSTVYGIVKQSGAAISVVSALGAGTTFSVYFPRSDGYALAQSAEHGGDALQLAEARDGELDLVLTDIVMPAMSGRELVEALRSRRPGVRVLYMSGYTDDEIVRRGLNDTSRSFIQKPFTAENLAMRVRRILDGTA